MTSLPFLQLRSLESIDPFKGDVESFLAKYGASNEISEAAYAEFIRLTDRIIAWLKREYAKEESNTSLFYDDGRNTIPYMIVDRSGPAYKGLDAWLSAQTRTEPHSGSIESQEMFNASPAGKMCRLIPALTLAYHMCQQEKKKSIKQDPRYKHFYRMYLWECLHNRFFPFSYITNSYYYDLPVYDMTYLIYKYFNPSCIVYSDYARTHGVPPPTREDLLRLCPFTREMYSAACRLGEKKAAELNANNKMKAEKKREAEKRKTDILAEAIVDAMVKRGLR